MPIASSGAREATGAGLVSRFGAPSWSGYPFGSRTNALR